MIQIGFRRGCEMTAPLPFGHQLLPQTDFTHLTPLLPSLVLEFAGLKSC
jgi:hypothetical protein